jgi:hypothetical protein
MKLPKDVAYEVGYMVKRIVVRPEYEKEKFTQEVAERLVRTSLLADSIAWYRYIRGEEVL